MESAADRQSTRGEHAERAVTETPPSVLDEAWRLRPQPRCNKLWTTSLLDWFGGQASREKTRGGKQWPIFVVYWGYLMKQRRFLYVITPILLIGGAAMAQHPVLDMVADEVIQKYRAASCEDLWRERGKPKSERAQQAIQLLRDDPQMREAFIDKVAAPIVNKMFECGLVP
jgi:hypothetical protein